MSTFFLPSSSSPSALQSVHPTNPRLKPILLSIDMDHTLVPWNAPRNVKEDIFKRNGDTIRCIAPTTSIHLNTAANLRGVKRVAQLPKIQPVLHQMPLDFLSVSSGTKLYVNTEQKPADEWIQSLEEEKTDVPTKTGAAISNLSQMFDKLLQMEGFKKKGNSPNYVRGPVEVQLQERVFPFARELHFVRKPERADTEPFTDRIFSELMDMGESADLRVYMRDSRIVSLQSEADRCYLFYSTKKAATQHVLDYMNDPKAVITAGDRGGYRGGTDEDMLIPRFYAVYRNSGKTPSIIPNYPIRSGNDPDLAEALLYHPRDKSVPKGDLRAGLLWQWVKATSQCLPDTVQKPIGKADSSEYDETLYRSRSENSLSSPNPASWTQILAGFWARLKSPTPQPTERTFHDPFRSRLTLFP